MEFDPQFGSEFDSEFQLKLQKALAGSRPADAIVQRFYSYYLGLRKQGEYLPLKPDGTVARYETAAQADISESTLRSNPIVSVLYAKAVEQTQEASKKAIEALLAGENLTAQGDGENQLESRSAASQAGRDEIKKLQATIDSLRQQLGVLQVAYDNALDRIQELEKTEQEHQRLKLQIERFEFQSEFAVNPGPYRGDD